MLTKHEMLNLGHLLSLPCTEGGLLIARDTRGLVSQLDLWKPGRPNHIMNALCIQHIVQHTSQDLEIGEIWNTGGKKHVIRLNNTTLFKGTALTDALAEIVLTIHSIPGVKR